MNSVNGSNGLNGLEHLNIERTNKNRVARLRRKTVNYRDKRRKLIPVVKNKLSAGLDDKAVAFRRYLDVPFHEALGPVKRDFWSICDNIGGVYHLADQRNFFDHLIFIFRQNEFPVSAFGNLFQLHLAVFEVSLSRPEGSQKCPIEVDRRSYLYALVSDAI